LEFNGFKLVNGTQMCNLVWTGKSDPSQQQQNNNTSPIWELSQLTTQKDPSLHHLEQIKATCQKVNHFPLSTELTRKDRLALNMQNMISKHGSENFGQVIPETFVLPFQLKEFKKAYF
jgi:hypothetical protein